MYARPLGFTYGALAMDPDLGQDMTAIGERLPDLPVSRLPSWIPGAATVQRYYADPATKAGTWIWLVGAATYLAAPRLLGDKGQQLRTAGGWAALIGLGSMAMGSRKSAPAVVELEVAAENALEAAAASEVAANGSNGADANGCPGYGYIGYGVMGPGGGIGVQGAQSNTSGGTVGAPPSTGGSSGGASGDHGSASAPQGQSSAGSYELQAQEVARLTGLAATIKASISRKKKTRNAKRLELLKTRINPVKQVQLRADLARLSTDLTKLQAQKVRVNSQLRRAERLLKKMPKPQGGGFLRAQRGAAKDRQAARPTRKRSAGPQSSSRGVGPALFAPTGGAPATVDTTADISDEPSDSPVGDDLPETTKDDAIVDASVTDTEFQVDASATEATPFYMQPVVLLGAAGLVGWGVWRARKGA